MILMQAGGLWLPACILCRYRKLLLPHKYRQVKYVPGRSLSVCKRLSRPLPGQTPL